MPLSRHHHLYIAIFTALGLDCSQSVAIEDAATDGTPSSGGLDPSNGGQTSGQTTPAATCDDPRVVTDYLGNDTGYVECADGAINRVRQQPVSPPPAGSCDGHGQGECTVDADCTAQPMGRCHITFYPRGCKPDCGCFYPDCSSDDECPNGHTCAPVELLHTEVARCVPGACVGPQDCESGECGFFAYDDACEKKGGVSCRTDADDCHASGECQDEYVESCFPRDEVLGEPWECGEGEGCTEGRPFRVAGRARVASPRRQSASVVAPVAELDVGVGRLARHVGEHWLRVAQMEHASIASFARASLHLISHAAPPDLLIATAQAMADEVRHAEAAFALASRFLGESVSAGALDLDGAVQPVTRAELIDALVREACVGETLAVATLVVAHEHATDPEVVDTLTTVIADETRHAALGWKTLAWLLRTGDASDRDCARRAFAEATRDEMAASTGDRANALVDPAAAAQLGVLDRARRDRARRDALEHVVWPSAMRLLSEVESTGHVEPDAVTDSLERWAEVALV